MTNSPRVTLPFQDKTIEASNQPQENDASRVWPGDLVKHYKRDDHKEDCVPASPSSMTPQTPNRFASDKEAIFQLQMEISTLKRHLELLDNSSVGGTSKTELLEVISEKDSIIQSKTKQISILNDKFQKITKAVSQMEWETGVLKKNNQFLESENKKISRHLSVREKEVSVLVSRCATQEEKLASGKGLLRKEMEELSNQLKRKEEEIDQLKEIEEELLQCQKEKDGLIQDKARIQKDSEKREKKWKTAITLLETDVNEKSNRNLELDDKLKKLEDLREKDIDEHRRESDSMKQKLLDRDNHSTELELRLKEYAEKIRSTEKAMDILQQEHIKDMASLKEDAEENGKQLEIRKQRMIDDLNNEKEEMRSKLLDELRTNEQELHNMGQKCDALVDANQILEKEIVTLSTAGEMLSCKSKEDAGRFQEERGCLNEQIQIKTRSIEKLKKMVEDLQDIKSSNENELHRVNDNLVSLRQDISIADEREKKLNESIKLSNEAVDKLRRELKNLCEDKSALERRFEYKSVEMEELSLQLREKLNKSKTDHEETKKTLISEKAQSKQAREEFDITTSRYSKQQELDDNEIMRLKERVNLLQSDCDFKEQELRNVKDGDLKNATDSATKLQRKIDELEAHIDTIETDRKAEVNEIKTELDDVNRCYKDLEELKHNEKLEFEKIINDLQEKLSNTTTNFTEKIATVEMELNHTNEELQIRRVDVENLRDELKVSAHGYSTQIYEQKKTMQEEIKRLNESHAAEMTELKERESEVMQMKDTLKTSQETIDKLRKKIVDLESQNQQIEMDAAEIVDELNEKIKIAMSHISTLKTQQSDESNQLQSKVQILETDCASLDTEISKLKRELVSKDAQIEERDASLLSLTKLRSEQEDNLKCIRSELEILITAYDKSKNEYSKKIVSLECNLDKLKVKAEQDATSFKVDYAKLQEVATKAEEKLELNAKDLSKVVSDLDERTQLLTEMVEHNKEVTKEFQDTQRLVKELQEEAETYHRNNERLKSDLNTMQKEREEEKEEFMTSLQKEIARGHLLEGKLEEVELALEEKMKECEDVAELRAANYLLKDKIERQSAFLKKKLDKERTMKKLPSQPPKTNTSTSRLRPPTRQGARSRSLSVGRRTSIEPRDVSTKKKMGADELDLLLGDDI